VTDDEEPDNGVDRLLAQLLPTLKPAVVRSTLGWPRFYEAPGDEGEQTGTGWPQ
jgi:hypothetical protein